MQDEYKGSRIGYVIEETTAYFISILISGAYLAKLTGYLGFSDSLTAVLSSFVAIGCSFQLLALALFRNGRVKRRVSLFYTLNEILFALLYFVPFIKGSTGVKTTIFVAFLLGGHFLMNMVSAPKTNWFMSLVPNDIRGRFTAMKEAVSLATGIAFQFGISSVIDRFEADGKMRTAFIICGVVIFLLTISHTLSLVLSKEKEPVEKEKQSVIKDFYDIITDKNALKIIGISCLWGVCGHISIPFYSTYMIKELGFSMTFVAAMSVVYAVSRISSSVFLGKYADKNSFAKMLRICYCFVASSFIVATFMMPSNGYIMYTLYHVFYAAAMGGINSAEINLVYDYVSPEKRTNALCIKQTLYGLTSFVTTLAFAPLVSYIQKSGNMFFGMNIYAQQVLSVIALFVSLGLIAYISRCRFRNKENQLQ